MKKCRICEVELTKNNWMPSLMKKNCVICRNCNNAKGQQWREKNRARANELANKWYHANPEKYHGVTTKHRRKLRIETLIEYGGKCVNCGIEDLDVLDIDHIFNDGAADRKKNLFAYNLFRQLKKQGYPKERHQVLCKNCNWKKEVLRRRNTSSL